MNYNWNWGIFFQTSPDGVHTYLETLLMGTGWTLATALSAWCLALAMGSLIGVIRTTANPWLVRLGNAYVELFRNIPLLVQMAYRVILPPLTSEFLNIIKNSAVALTIGLMELTARARAMQEFSFQVFEAFTAATVIYLVINIVVTFGMRWVERRTAVPGFIGAAPAAAAH